MSTAAGLPLDGSTIAITGATGFLGRYLVDTLLERNAHVIGVVRNPDRGADLAARGVELRRADLADAEALTTAFRGADAIVSNAALVSLGGSQSAELIRTNVAGTTNVFAAAEAAQVARVIQISSCTVYDAPTVSWTRENRDESWPLRTQGGRVTRINAYGYSKAMAERLAWARSAEAKIGLTTIRPSTIFGCGDPNFLPFLRRLMAWPICPFPTGARISLVYAGDIARGVALALETPAAIGRAYNMGGDEATLWELTRVMRSLDLETSAIQIPIPFPMRIPWTSERAMGELGWTRRSLRDALLDTVAREATASARAPR